MEHLSLAESEEVKRKATRRRSRVLGVAAIALFVAMIARLYALQILQAPTYQAQAVANQVRTVSVEPPRGLILDRNGQVLVGNQVVEVLALSQHAAAVNQNVVSNLAKLLSVPVAQINQALASTQFSPYEPTPVAYGISKQVVIDVEEHPNIYPGVIAEQTTQRFYPQGDTAAQVLGYVGQITQSQLTKLASKGYTANSQIGLAGVEATYESYLRGKPGVTKLEVTAGGNVVGTLGQTPPVPGGNLQLTIDTSLQKVVETDLANEIKALSHTYVPHLHAYLPELTGAAVVENPNNGQVLAMASFPTYNPSIWVGGISTKAYAQLNAPSSNYPLLNRAIQGEYTPGSTFKLATASAALNTGLISPYSLIHDPGSFTIPGCHIGKCSFHNSGNESLGTINIVTALTASDDVFFYTLGYLFYTQEQKYGTQPIQDMAARYGWGVPTGILLPGEASGSVDSPTLRQYLHKNYPAAYPYDTWYTADQLEMAFGQGETLITPLQMANAYATFANGGTRYVPSIAVGVVNGAGKLIKSFPPQIATRVLLSPLDHQTMLTGFEGAVGSPGGTAYGAFQGFPLNKFPLAGKTGTASVTGLNPNSWFVAFGPVQAPKYVVSVVIKEGGFGASAAAPVAREIFQYLMAHPVGPPKFGVGHLTAGSTTPLGATTSTTSTTSAKAAGANSNTTSTTNPAG